MIRPTIPFMSYTWQSQARQFEKVGEPGISYEYHDIPTTTPDGVHHLNAVECLLYRNKSGRLVGILYYYPEGGIERDGTVLEKPGACNVLVKPECQRQGIASRLVTEAESRWDIDFGIQDFTPSGAAFANHRLGLTPSPQPDQIGRE